MNLWAKPRGAINRHNARKSTGPITPEGKERTRQNALKHGLCAAAFALPHENADRLQDQFDEWVAHYQPVGPAEFALVEEIAHAQLRLRRCRLREAALLDRQVAAAEEVWRNEQIGRLRAALVRIVTDPTAVEDVRGCGVGRRWMLGRWMQLGEVLLRDRYCCAPALLDEGVRLLGGDPARPAAGPLVAYEFRLACTGARSAPDQKLLAWLVSDAAIHPVYLAQHGREVPTPAACRDLVEKIVAAAIAALEQEENDGQEDEQDEADDACRRAQVPSDSPDTKLSLRYESMARAALHKALKTLDLLQDARYAAEAEAGAPDVIALADTPPEPLPSMARNEPDPPQEPQPSAAPETGYDASTDTNPDVTKASGWLGSRRRDPGAAGPGSRRRAPSHPDAPALPVVTPVMAASPPA